MSSRKQTADVWLQDQRFQQIQLLNRYGWERADDPRPWETPITEAEFCLRVMSCRLRIRNINWPGANDDHNN